MTQRMPYKGDIPGANSNSYVLWDSADDDIGIPLPYYVLRPRFSHAGVLVAEYRDHDSETWREFERIPALPAPDLVSHVFSVNVAAYPRARVRWDNGGSPQSSFDILQYLSDTPLRLTTRYPSYIVNANLAADFAGEAIQMRGRDEFKLTFTSTATGTPNGKLSLQSTDDGSSWSDIVGAEDQYPTAGNLSAQTRVCVWYGLNVEYVRPKWTVASGGTGATFNASARAR